MYKIKKQVRIIILKFWEKTKINTISEHFILIKDKDEKHGAIHIV